MKITDYHVGFAYCAFCDDNNLGRIDISDQQELENWIRLYTSAFQMAVHYTKKMDATRMVEDCRLGL